MQMRRYQCSCQSMHVCVFAFCVYKLKQRWGSLIKIPASDCVQSVSEEHLCATSEIFYTISRCKCNQNMTASRYTGCGYSPERSEQHTEHIHTHDTSIVKVGTTQTYKSVSVVFIKFSGQLNTFSFNIVALLFRCWSIFSHRILHVERQKRKSRHW